MAEDLGKYCRVLLSELSCRILEYTLDYGIIMESKTKTKTQRSQAINCNILGCSNRKHSGEHASCKDQPCSHHEAVKAGPRAIRMAAGLTAQIGSGTCTWDRQMSNVHLSQEVFRCCSGRLGGWGIDDDDSSIWPWIFLSLPAPLSVRF